MVDVDPITLYRAFRAGHIRRLPNGFWRDPETARAVLESIWVEDGISTDQAPAMCRRRWYDQHRLSSLLARVYRGSPSLVLLSLYPERYAPADFPEVPKARDLQQRAFTASGVEWDADPMRRWDLSQRLRSDHQGKCRMCHRPRVEGTRLCSEHLEYYRAKYRARYADWRAQDLCYRCGSRPPTQAGACGPCYKRILLSRARQRRRHYWTNKARGLCGYWRCFEPAELGYVYCARHRAEERARYRRLNYARKARENRARRKTARRVIHG